MPKIIVGFSGKLKSGKTTLAGLLAGKLLQRGLMVDKVSFGDPLKREISEIFGIPLQDMYSHIKKEECIPIVYHGDKIPMKLREVMQWWGTEVRRAEDKDYWLKRFRQECLSSKADVVLCDDVRFPNEADFILDGVSVPSLLIRIEAYVGYTEPGTKHASECMLDKYSRFSMVLFPKYAELDKEVPTILEAVLLHVPRVHTT